MNLFGSSFIIVYIDAQRYDISEKGFLLCRPEFQSVRPVSVKFAEYVRPHEGKHCILVCLKTHFTNGFLTNHLSVQASIFWIVRQVDSSKRLRKILVPSLPLL